MTHDAQCEIRIHGARHGCQCCERALAQAQGELQALKAEKYTAWRFGTPFDPTGAKTGTEINSLRAEVDRLKDGWTGYIRSCPWCGTDTGDWVITRTIFHLIDHGNTFRAQVERLTAALTELANISRSECGACIEHQEIARAALTEPGGQS